MSSFNMPTQSLKKNLLLWLLIPLISLFVARSAYTDYVTSPNIASRVYDRSLNSTARSIAQQILFDANGTPSINLSNRALETLLSDDMDKMFFSVKTSNGNLVAGNAKLAASTHRQSSHNDFIFFNSTLNDEDIRVVEYKYHPANEYKNAYILIKVAETLNKRKQLKEEIFNSTIIPQIMLISLATIAVLIGIIKGLTPLCILHGELSSRSDKDMRPVDTTLAPIELHPVIHAINDLMGRLALALSVQSRFAADAAHQLRTPLAGLKAQVDLVLRQPTLEDMKKELNPLTISADRLSRLINQLLALSCNDHDVGRLHNAGIIDLNTLTADTTREWVPEALKKGIDLGFSGDTLPATIFGNVNRLQEMISNLLDNAIRYTQNHGVVTAKVIAVPPTLIIEDNGDGIPVAEQQRVFERFYRILGSRSDGSGLGLSIVQEIAISHQARIQLYHNSSGKGTVVKIEFPPYAV